MPLYLSIITFLHSMSTEKKPNKLTEKAGLTFNVNTTKQKLKSYYEGQDLTTPMFSGGHTAVAASLEKLWEMLLQECLKRVGKDKSGVRQVNRESLQYSVLMHTGLKKYFVTHFDTFDNTVEYRDQSPVITAELDKVMERVDKDLSLTSKARNLASFMLLKVFSQLASTAHSFMEYARKKSVDGRSVMFAVSTLFHESVSSELNKEIVRVMKEFGEELEEAHASSETPADTQQEAAGEADEGDGDDEKPETSSKSKGGKKGAAATKETKESASTGSSKKGGATSTKNTKKKAEAIEEEEPDEGGDDAGEEQEEAEEKPAPAKSTKKTTGGAKDAGSSKKPANPPKQTKGGKK